MSERNQGKSEIEEDSSAHETGAPDRKTGRTREVVLKDLADVHTEGRKDHIVPHKAHTHVTSGGGVNGGVPSTASHNTVPHSPPRRPVSGPKGGKKDREVVDHEPQKGNHKTDPLAGLKDLNHGLVRPRTSPGREHQGDVRDKNRTRREDGKSVTSNSSENEAERELKDLTHRMKEGNYEDSNALHRHDEKDSYSDDSLDDVDGTQPLQKFESSGFTSSGSDAEGGPRRGKINFVKNVRSRATSQAGSAASNVSSTSRLVRTTQSELKQFTEKYNTFFVQLTGKLNLSETMTQVDVLKQINQINDKLTHEEVFVTRLHNFLYENATKSHSREVMLNKVMDMNSCIQAITSEVKTRGELLEKRVQVIVAELHAVKLELETTTSDNVAFEDEMSQMDKSIEELKKLNAQYEKQVSMSGDDVKRQLGVFQAEKHRHNTEIQQLQAIHDFTVFLNVSFSIVEYEQYRIKMLL